MAISSAAGREDPAQRPGRDPAGWLALAATPACALMACLAAREAAPMALCARDAGLLPAGGMPTMYLLMSLFHLPPWLRLAARRARAGR